MGKVYFDRDGYEITYDQRKDAWSAVRRGFLMGGKLVWRGGKQHPEDAVFANFNLAKIGMENSRSRLSSPVRDTFIDSLEDRRDLAGNVIFRHSPMGDAQKRMFAMAFDAAQRMRTKASILATDIAAFTLAPSLVTVVDCMARDADGRFWLINMMDGSTDAARKTLLLAAYVMERGMHIPDTASVMVGAWRISVGAPLKFFSWENDKSSARDAVIEHLLDTPF